MLADDLLSAAGLRVVRDLQLGPPGRGVPAQPPLLDQGDYLAIGCAAHGHRGGAPVVERPDARALRRGGRATARAPGRRRGARRRRRGRRGSSALALRTRAGVPVDRARPRRWSRARGGRARRGGRRPARAHPAPAGSSRNEVTLRLTGGAPLAGCAPDATARAVRLALGTLDCYPDAGSTGRGRTAEPGATGAMDATERRATVLKGGGGGVRRHRAAGRVPDRHAPPATSGCRAPPSATT